MSAIPFEVIHAFKRKEYARSGNLVSMGDALYSYALKLAHWEDGRIVLDVDPKAKAPSVTTARHLHALRDAL